MPMPAVVKFDVEGPLQITPVRFGDTRGYFAEVYNKEVFGDLGVTSDFVQDNHSLSVGRGVLRGLHFQIAPFAQAKLVRVVRGTIFDVAIDIRGDSPTYGRSVTATLSAENGHQLFVPAGFAHGFCTLEAETEVLYKVDARYSREHERGLRWDDPALAIQWPIDPETALLIDRDRTFPLLGSLPRYF
jgi:dTDP-4-dehydrorhamnose 3,5-epimerase